MAEPIYDAPHLARNPANFTALTPLGFLPRTAAIYPDKLAVIDGPRHFTYRELHERCLRFADALRRRGIGVGDTVAVMAPNVPALLEAHYGVPMAGAVLNALNYRLDARSIGFILGHGAAELLIADREFAPLAKAALAELGKDIPVVEIDAEHKVTHLCGAPIVLSTLVHAPDNVKRCFDHVVEVATGGAAPPSPVIEAMERMGFRVTHLYGLTESYGPSTPCAWQEEWAELPLSERAAKMARQGVQYLTLDRQRVADPVTLQDVPADGMTIGELLLRSNTLMKGYLKNPAATEEAFAGGWFHTGDLAVMHPDAYVEIKDRSKDIIISGGENISSIEVEEVLYRHPQIMEAAVVAKPDEKWGETPCAFVTLKPDAGEVAASDIIAWCRANLAHFKVPKSVVFEPLPKTSTGKIQKYALRDRAKEIAS